MNKPTEVGLCIAAYGPVSWNFVGPLVGEVSDAFLHGVHFKRRFIKTTMATDKNRNAIVEEFLKSDLQWSYWQDADNTNPVDACTQLLKTAKAGNYKVVCGMYFQKREPYRPLAYKQLPDGRYNPIQNWSRGEIIEIDAAGMNCVLIHREVFEAVANNYRPLQRLGTGGVVSIHKDDIIGDIHDSNYSPDEGKVVDGIWYQRMILPANQSKTPFFFSEYNRTEDIPFFEMVKRLGYNVALDTMVRCGHLRDREISEQDYLDEKDNGEEEEN